MIPHEQDTAGREVNTILVEHVGKHVCRETDRDEIILKAAIQQLHKLR
jgi:hypothetical protein